MRNRSDSPAAVRSRAGVADSLKDLEMDVVIGLCTVVPVMVLTVTAVLGIATVMSLSSWALL